MLKTVSLAIMAVFYIVAGLGHFRSPGMYLKIMPPWLPAPLLLVYISGVAEAVLGALLFFPSLQHWAAWGIVALLAAVFPANIYMFQRGGAAFGMPQWLLVARLPLQLVLMVWAYCYT
jgi:uncharacterized membrane protein